MSQLQIALRRKAPDAGGDRSGILDLVDRLRNEL
jgi:hypothetical protein